MISEETAAPDVTQSYGQLLPVRIGLADEVRHKSVMALNRILAHTLALRDLYKKNHWQTSGVTFYQLHLLFDKHYSEQDDLADAVAERVQTLGGVALALAQDVAQESRISRAPRGREAPIAQLEELLRAHETILKDARVLAREATDRGDDGTNDLLVSQIVRGNELQSWFIGEHLMVKGSD
jgi:starvation-inducible DNA-binding protein